MLQYIVMFLYECTDLYVKWKIAFEAWAHATYQNVSWVRKTIDAIHQFKKDTYNNYYRIRTEPDIGEWVNMSYSIQYDGCGDSKVYYYYCEKYDQLHTDKNAFTETYILGTQNIQYRASYTHGTLPEKGLWLAKCNDSCYASRVLPAIDEKVEVPQNILDIDSRKPSKVRFLSIIYSHPKMIHNIELQLPNTMYYVGNELFSAVFVLRMLEYIVGSGSYYVFDMDYTLKLLDRNVKYTELSSKEYIILGEQSYDYTVSVL
jgi:hypothetical protein